MIHLPEQNDLNARAHFSIRNDTYLICNLVFSGFILMLFMYFLIFSPDRNNYPVVCIHEKITGQACSSCGLSHSLSLILRGRIEEALRWNENGIAVFIFFVSQFFLRLFFSHYYVNNPDFRKQLIVTDIAGSSLIFLLAFMPFIINIFRWL
ncbi:MAG TPA: DUF2752 domain-containing protein [Bacteroidales bacterium]|jgi:hypothetical protein|nr:DUF2752 domain-containing protein [Bacteroidales bacterium]HPY67187.1 DUF2752 domain-containing protein [Bacteroidales bacterium]HQB36213.1 DUF2752 domain-containing protein [Bacteroidales bacterium]